MTAKKQPKARAKLLYADPHDEIVGWQIFKDELPAMVERMAKASFDLTPSVQEPGWEQCDEVEKDIYRHHVIVMLASIGIRVPKRALQRGEAK